MAQAPYSFLDVAVLDEVRQRLAAGDALAILSTDLEQVIWANGAGAALFGYSDIGAAIGASPRLGFATRRQISATSGFPSIGRDRAIMVRMSAGMTSQAVAFLASTVVLPDGEPAILLASPAAAGGGRSEAQIAERAIQGFNEAGHFVAFVDEHGKVEAASSGFSKLGIAQETLAAMVARLDGAAGRIAKRIIPGVHGPLPAGMARLTDRRHLVVVIDEGRADAEVSASQAAADTSERAPDEAAAEPARETRTPAIGAAPAETADPSTGPVTIAAELPDVSSFDAKGADASYLDDGISSETIGACEGGPAADDAAAQLAEAVAGHEAAESVGTGQDLVPAAQPETNAAEPEGESDSWYFSQPENAVEAAAPPLEVEVPVRAATEATDAAEAPTPDTVAAGVENEAVVPTPDTAGLDVAESGTGLDEPQIPPSSEPEQGEEGAADVSAEAVPDGTEVDAPVVESLAAPVEASSPEAAEPVSETGPTATEAAAIAPKVDRASAPVRFVWRTDADGRFSQISPEFADAVGEAAADVIGRDFQDVARVLGLDPSGEIAGLLARRDTWSGRSVLWPVAGTDLKIPVDLAALPIYGRTRNFEGFRGFGVARAADAVVDPDGLGMALVPAATPQPNEAPKAELADAVASDAPSREDPFQGEVPALTIVPVPERRYSDKVIRLAEHRQPANDKGLSTGERVAFQQIGERLKKDSAEAAPPAQPLEDAAPAAANDDRGEEPIMRDEAAPTEAAEALPATEERAAQPEPRIVSSVREARAADDAEEGPVEAENDDEDTANLLALDGAAIGESEADAPDASEAATADDPPAPEMAATVAAERVAEAEMDREAAVGKAAGGIEAETIGEAPAPSETATGDGGEAAHAGSPEEAATPGTTAGISAVAEPIGEMHVEAPSDAGASVPASEMRDESPAPDIAASEPVVVPTETEQQAVAAAEPAMHDAGPVKTEHAPEVVAPEAADNAGSRARSGMSLLDFAQWDQEDEAPAVPDAAGPADTAENAGTAEVDYVAAGMASTAHLESRWPAAEADATHDAEAIEPEPEMVGQAADAPTVEVQGGEPIAEPATAVADAPSSDDRAMDDTAADAPALTADADQIVADAETPTAEVQPALPADEPHVEPQNVEAPAAVTEEAVAPSADSPVAEEEAPEAATAAEPDFAREPEAERPIGTPRKPAAFVPSVLAPSRKSDTSILEKLPVPVLVHSGDALHYANTEFLAFTGYGSVDELAQAGGIGALFVDPYDDDDSPERSDRQLRLKTRGGEEFPVEAFLQSVPWNGGKALLLVLAHAREAAFGASAGQSPLIAELEARVAEMRTIIDTATDGVVLMSRDGTIRSISRPAEALFGFDSDEVAGKPFASLFAIESQRAARDYLSSLSDHGVASVLNDGREVIGREAEGRFIPMFMTIGKLPSDSGYCAVVRDITQWKRAEEELTQARAVAERASSHKTEFLARISHEIRTPLNAIIGFSELMVDEKFGPVANDRYRDYLRDINRSGNHVLDLVNDLLDISKIEAGQQEMAYEAVSLNDTLAETVAMMQPQANRERVIIRSSLASKLPDVVADRRSVRQIALNILSNAVRYTQAGGQVIVSTAYEVTGDVVMRVRDTGIGMTQAEIEQALKPFKQINSLKRARGDGTGLGLPLTKAMVEANRAKFTINSTPGEGTLVEISFPSTRVLAE